MKHNGKYKKITKAAAKNKSYVGYCYSPQHKGYITAAVLKHHSCLCKAVKDSNGNVTVKECPCLQKLEHPYWTEKEHAKLLRKLKKFIENTSITERELKKICEAYKWNEEYIVCRLNELLGKNEA